MKRVRIQAVATLDRRGLVLAKSVHERVRLMGLFAVRVHLMPLAQSAGGKIRARSARSEAPLARNICRNESLSFEHLELSEPRTRRDSLSSKSKQFAASYKYFAATRL